MKWSYITAFALAILLTLGQSCSLPDSAAQPQGSALKLIGEYTLSIPEPSGLTLHDDYSGLWTVSDHTNRVYSISLDGQLLQELRFEGNDLEGIAFDSRDNSLWVVEEQLREAVQIDLNGKETARKAINLPGTGNSGLEGICLDTLFTFYVLNEKNPRLWAKLNSDFSTALQRPVDDVEDISGIAYDIRRKSFWIVSDQSQLLFLWDAGSGLIKRYDLPFEKAEGVAHNPELDRIYIVSDKTAKLYVYAITEEL